MENTAGTAMEIDETNGVEEQALFHDVFFTVVPSAELPATIALEVCIMKRQALLYSAANNVLIGTSRPRKQRRPIHPLRRGGKRHQAAQRSHAHYHRDLRLSTVRRSAGEVHTRSEAFMGQAQHRQG
jgi:hypothetical protein